MKQLQIMQMRCLTFNAKYVKIILPIDYRGDCVMKKAVINLFIISSQLFIVGLFCGTMFNKNVNVEKHVSTIHNENLDKIATSVSLLFKNAQEESITDIENKMNDLKLEELPSVEEVDKELRKKEEENSASKKEIESVPLKSVEIEKYHDNLEMGFQVSEGNQTYSLDDYEFNVVVAVVAGEFDETFDDALGVVSVILNRCESEKWRNWAGTTPYQQVIKPGQFEIYFNDAYLKYMPGGSLYGGTKYNISRQAVIDGFGGIRNNSYLGFRAWWVSGYSDKYIVYGGNRYGYN